MSEDEDAAEVYSSTTLDPFEGPKAHRKHVLLSKVRNNMRKTWRKDDHLLANLFPVSPKTSAYQNARAELYNDRPDRKRWKRIPATPNSVSALYTPLTNLFNRILFHCKISKFRRLFINTHIRRRKVHDIWPGIVLSGIGPEFLNSSAPLPRAIHDSFISAFEIALESDNLLEARDRLAVNMHRIFQFQDNRRFAFGMVVTQDTFTVYMFDHAGGVASARCNYHANPEQFFAVISGLAGEGTSIGFDTTVLNKSKVYTIRTLESCEGAPPAETHYNILGRIFKFSSVVGRGTLCWFVSPVGDPDQYFIIKDAWIAVNELEGRESEGSLLRHARSMGVTTGVVQIHHMEDVRLSADPSDLDTILRNRRNDSTPAAGGTIDRVHRRIVMQGHGKTLDLFSTRKELILAFYDAVLAHQNLHRLAGIIHRDISPRNILINIEGIEGDRGILIDLDHAIRVGDTSPYSTKRKIGTWRFMSRNVLAEYGPHTFLDDLESFFYVITWIVAVYQRPHVATPYSQLPEVLSFWDRPGSSTLKHGLFLYDDFPLSLSPWFGKCFHDLIVRLYKFFQSRNHIFVHMRAKPNPVKDYEEFLGHIRQCISEMEAEDLLAGHSMRVPAADDGHADADTRQEVQSIRRRRKTFPELKSYPKRSTANYGEL